MRCPHTGELTTDPATGDRLCHGCGALIYQAHAVRNLTGRRQTGSEKPHQETGHTAQDPGNRRDRSRGMADQ
ncbi:hypothetical protein SAMN05421773_12014 [Streptomyces aidingensis]|uniref:Uncharacterized protein n=1 Tax=Streptomyces aidingensis TaxID=910347 RepID=A0A1I1TJW9_9ACTN|nr:hypothetical protein SAMN05421773_12014 [Streptomyces aidingensis]